MYSAVKTWSRQGQALRPSQLSSQEIHVWWAAPSELQDPVRVARYRALLAPEEVARHERFRSPEQRHRYLITRALVRCTLSRYADVDPSQWTFQASPQGRPEIAGAASELRLSFNLSNTPQLVGCAIARDREIGLDVETTARECEATTLADRLFTRAEAAALRALPDEHRRDRFFDLWTLKEAYLKARGLGLRIPLDSFSFRIGEAIAIAFDDSLGDRASSWRFALFSPTPRHRAAVAVRFPPECTLQIEKWWWAG